MDKLYKVELKGIGEIIADLETMEKISDILLEAAGYNNDMIEWCDKAGQNSATFYDTFNNRKENHEFLRDLVKRDIMKLKTSSAYGSSVRKEEP